MEFIIYMHILEKPKIIDEVILKEMLDAIQMEVMENVQSENRIKISKKITTESGVPTLQDIKVMGDGLQGLNYLVLVYLL